MTGTAACAGGHPARRSKSCFPSCRLQRQKPGAGRVRDLYSSRGTRCQPSGTPDPKVSHHRSASTFVNFGSKGTLESWTSQCRLVLKFASEQVENSSELPNRGPRFMD